MNIGSNEHSCIRELLHPKWARQVSELLGKRPVATKSSASRFICVPDGPKVGSCHGVCFAAADCFDYRDDGLRSYAKSEITRNLKKSICLAMSMRVYSPRKPPQRQVNVSAFLYHASNSRFRLFRKARSAISVILECRASLSVILECRASLTRPAGV